MFSKKKNLLHFQDPNLKFEEIPQARITLYGPKVLVKVIEPLNITKTENDGKTFSFDFIYRVHAPESVIDIPLGITDEQNLQTFYGKFSFSDDCPDFINPSLLSLETKEMQDQHNRRPKNRRVKYKTLSSDNPFNFESDKILKPPSDLIPVKIVPLGKGVPQRYSFIYSKVDGPTEDEKSLEDIEMDNDEEETTQPPSKRVTIDEVPLLTTPVSNFTKIIPMPRLFEVEIKPKLSRGIKRRSKKKAEKRREIIVKDERNVEKSKDSKIPQGTVIGRIVRGLRWSS
uniref:Uncharacterized protein n=1 Tax=Panagrolaimus davidi TaxID=227884 RepID=A0A914Q182_9BILA